MIDQTFIWQEHDFPIHSKTIKAFALCGPLSAYACKEIPRENTICSGHSKTLVPSNLLTELRLADGGGENSRQSESPKKNNTQRGSLSDRLALYSFSIYQSEFHLIRFNCYNRSFGIWQKLGISRSRKNPTLADHCRSETTTFLPRQVVKAA